MNRPLYKSNNDKVILGVCGGIAEYFGFDILTLRIIWVISLLFAGSGILLYLLLAILMPTNNSNI